MAYPQSAETTFNEKAFDIGLLGINSAVKCRFDPIREAPQAQGPAARNDRGRTAAAGPCSAAAMNVRP
jgi:hypothetical protein